MASRNGSTWLKEQRVIAILIVGLATGLTVAGCVAAGSSSGGAKTPSDAAGSAPAQATSSPTASSSTASSPAASISLAGWKLTLPVDRAGQLSGAAQALSAAVLVPPWLTRNADGSLTFWAPAGAATTPNSGHSRTELVSTSAFALGAASHTLAATLAVTQVPDTDHDIIVGQIHGGGSISSVPFVMLHWRAGDIVVVVKRALSGSSAQNFTLLQGVPLGGRFGYTISDAGDGELSLTATYAGRTGKAAARIPEAFLGTEMRFQVGDYQQATSGTSAADGGRVVFYAITSS
jgi:Alginate lyase